MLRLVSKFYLFLKRNNHKRMLVYQTIDAKQRFVALTGQQFSLTKRSKIPHLLDAQFDVGNIGLWLSEIQTISQEDAKNSFLKMSGIRFNSI